MTLPIEQYRISRKGNLKSYESFHFPFFLERIRIKLNNGLLVRLIGVKEKKQANGRAIEFLQLKTKGQKVFLKYDEIKHDENNHLMVYLY
ncbi:MAG: hypothetical protein SRB1_01769 [Desulfobacteraceae bacterium Eth-SRB1]|nr:MAG: hypothetical protein SRB1_01769 [Desulfobacteraceae bacterium Eth-SRB1]